MEKIFDVVIIGSGPAGLSSGIYTGRALLKTLILNSFNYPSQAIFADVIENYPGFYDGINGFELIENFKKQAEKFGCEMINEEVVKIEEKEGNFFVYTLNSKNFFVSKSVILATGRRSKKLGIENEDTLTGKGVSYCAVCDAMLYKDKTVALVGGGDTAFSEAIFISRFVKKLYLIHRRKSFRATKILQKRLFEKENVIFYTPYVIEKILGEKKLQCLEIRNLDTNEKITIECDGLFVCIGYQPNTEFLNGFIDLDDEGYIVTDENLNTSKKGIFACGDCRKGSTKQIIYASAEGAKAGLSVVEFLENK